MLDKDMQQLLVLGAISFAALVGLCTIIIATKPQCPAGAEQSYDKGWHCEVPYLEKR